MLREYLSTLANKFREILGTTDKINAQDFADKINKVKIYGWNEGMQQGYDMGKTDGYNSAVKEGTITVLENNKELKIEGLPKAPKTFNLVACNANSPPSDDIYWIRGLNYIADGFYFANNTNKILSLIWLATTQNASALGAANGSIAEVMNNRYNLITFENGAFTIKMREQTKYYYGENFTYKWIATF